MLELFRRPNIYRPNCIYDFTTICQQPHIIVNCYHFVKLEHVEYVDVLTQLQNNVVLSRPSTNHLVFDM